MRLIWMGLLFVLAGCAGMEKATLPLVGAAGSCPELNQDQQLALSLANEMVTQGRRYAALAHLQRMPQHLPQMRLGQAKILRSLDEPEAESIYQGLLSSCLAADAEHGLGLLATQSERYQQAINHLEKARSLAPTNADIRNDLGVVYLSLGREKDARFEFITALELEQSSEQPAKNLLALLYYQQREEAAADFATKMALSAKAMAQAKSLAERLRQSKPAQRVLHIGHKVAGKEEP